MNPALTDDLFDQLRGGPLQQLGQHLGLGPEQAAAAVGAALPLLIGALGRNARQPSGADALYGALERDHRGLDPGNVLGSVLAGGGQGDGILGHIFGPRQSRVAQTLGPAAGLDQDRSHVLLRVLAPIVMSYLARRVFTSRQADGATTLEPSPQGLGQALEQETHRLRSEPGPRADLLSTLDSDGDSTDDGITTQVPPQPLSTMTAEMRSPRPLL